MTFLRIVSSNRHPALAFWWSMIFFRKPVPTPDQARGRLFRDHALIGAPIRRHAIVIVDLDFAAPVTPIELLADGKPRRAPQPHLPEIQPIAPTHPLL